MAKVSFDVHWLDFSKSKPKPAAGKCVIHIEHSDIQHDDVDDMCFVQDGGKQLLIVAAHSTIFAFNIENDSEKVE